MSEVKLIEWFDDHFYKVDGEFFPSVTTILGAEPKPFLSQWRGQVGNWEANRIMSDAADKGTRIHRAAELLANGFEIILDKTIQNDEISYKNKMWFLHEQQDHLEVYRIHQFFQIVKPKVLSTEIIIYNQDEKFAGTVDLIIDVPEGDYNICGAKPIHLEAGRYIADYKTGKEIYPSHYRQLGAYKNAYEMMTDDSIKGALILHSNAAQTKKGIAGFKCIAIDKDTLETSYEQFLKIKSVYDIAPLYKPKIFSLPQILKLETEYDTEQ